jgi:hypothetical protein
MAPPSSHDSGGEEHPPRRVRTPRESTATGNIYADTEAAHSPVRQRELRSHQPFAAGAASAAAAAAPSRLGNGGGSGSGSGSEAGPSGRSSQQQPPPPPRRHFKSHPGVGPGGGDDAADANTQQRGWRQQCASFLDRPLFTLPACGSAATSSSSTTPSKPARVVVTPLRLALSLAAVAAVVVAIAAAGAAAARSTVSAPSSSADYYLSSDPVVVVDPASVARAPGEQGPADVYALARAPGPALSTVDGKFCAQLPQADKQLCYSYIKASSPGAKTLAAANWRKSAPASHRCSGLADACVKRDADSKRVDSSACRPAAPRAGCDLGGGKKGNCMSGLCVAPPPPPRPPAAAAANMRPNNKPPNNNKQPGRQVLESSPRGPRRGPPAPSAPVAGWGQMTVVVDPTEKGQAFPPTGTFLGTSHEWRRIADWGVNTPAFAAIFKQYGRQPIIRIGGASQDAIEEAPGADTWQSLAAIARATNAKIIIGLPLYQPGKALDMSRQMIKDAYRYLPRGSLLLFELGNEPEFWPRGVGGYRPARSLNFVSGAEAFLDYWTDAAKELNPCEIDLETGRRNPQSNERARAPIPTAAMSGPSWGNVNTIEPSIVRRMAERNRCSLKEMNVHYYPYVDNTTITAPELLAEPLVQFGVEKYRVLQQLATNAGYRMRISETNSLFGGGRVGLSDTYTGALWAADLALAFANAGAVGFHVHWGFGGAPIVGGAPNVGVQTNFFDDDPRRPYPSVHAPFYGALFFVGATGGPDVSPQDLAKTRFVSVYPLPPAAVGGPGCDANLKTWATVDARGVLRVAAINKEERLGCNLELRIGSVNWGKATVLRMLPGADGLRSKGGITWAGQTYDGTTDGRIRGQREAQTVAPVKLDAEQIGMKFAPGLSYTVAMPALSGAVIEIPPGRS